jgi:hypothetical protein
MHANIFTDHFVTTGIHNPAKFPKEPFRWAGDFPSENQIFINASTSGTSIRPMTQTPLTVPLSDMATTIFTEMATSTREWTYYDLQNPFERKLILHRLCPEWFHDGIRQHNV